MLELAVLGLLKEQPLHGYELRKRLSDALGLLWGVSYGSLYPALRRLERSGAIEVVEAGAAEAPAAPMPATGSIGGEAAAARMRRLTKGSRRTRKAYRLTAHGEQMFGELMTSDSGGGAEEERSFALKLAFCRYLPVDARLELLERRRADLAARLSRARGSRSGGDHYALSLLEHRRKSTERDLEWLDELIATERRARAENIQQAANAPQQGATA
jgi:DNA-binding PadR family transcriptional regulator